MGTYFWIEKYNDGSVRLRLMSHEECEAAVNRRVDTDEIPVYLTQSFPKYFNDMKDGSVMIIRGSIVCPKPVQEVIRYEISDI